MSNFGRLLTAMVTPFHTNRSINYKAAAQLAEYLVNNGSDGVVVAGSTGESATLSHEEKLKLFSAVLDAIGDRATVIAGTGSNDTQASIALTEEAEKLGVHGSMLVGPYYNKPSQEGFYQHFKAIADSTGLPLVLYNVPGRTASNILPATIVRLTECKNIVAVKEASGSLDQVSEILRTAPQGFQVYSGDDSLTLPVMAIGGTGVISVAGHAVGNQICQMIQSFIKGDITKARDIHLALMPFFKVIFITTNPIPIKTVVNLLGIDAGPLRLPLVQASDVEEERIKKVMTDLGIPLALP